MMSSDDGGAGGNKYAALRDDVDNDAPDAQPLVLKSDIRPLDVLVGRGYFRHPGNVRFLRIVAARKEEYKAESTCDAKDRIANEVVERVYDPAHLSGAEDGFGPAAAAESDGYGNYRQTYAAGQLLPGRFLQLESGDIKKPTSVWRPISGKAVIDKVKMALRQKARGKAAKAKAASTVRVSPESNGSNSASMHGNLSQKMQSKQEGKRRLGEGGGAVSPEEGNDNGGEQLLPLSEYFDGDVDGDDNLFFDDLNLEDKEEELEIGPGEHGTNSVSGGTKIGIATQRAPSSGSGDSLGHPLPSVVPGQASAQSEEMLQTRQRLLENLQFALKRVQMQSSEHQAAAAAGLEAIGRELCLRFAGVDPDLFQRAHVGASINASTSPVASSSNGGHSLPSQNPRKRTGMVGSVQKGSPSPSFSAASSPSPGLGGGTASLSDRLRDAGLPISLCAVITSFLGAMDPNISDRYLSFADAAADLGRMIADPDRYLFDPPMDRYHGTLHFVPNRLYGRSEAWAKVKLSFDKIIVTQEESHGFLMISGPPGSGKTALVEKLRDPLAERRGMVVWIKFDSQQQEYPMINICRGFDEYFQSLLCGDSTLLQEIGSAIKESLGANMTVLRDLIPALGIVVGGWPESHYNAEGRETYNLILYCIKKLVNVIAHPSHPVVVLFDDLQWSDDASQEIIRMLVTDESSRAAMFIGCYRDNEVDANHPVSQGVGAILMALVPLAIVNLGNLDRESVNDLCSDVLHLSPRLTRPLADALHSKTSGNPMFVRQLMCSLSEEGLLYYSASERRWRWDINAIRIKAVADNAVDLFIAMMRSYSPELRWLLQIASCLGFRFDMTAIALLASASEEMALADESLISTHIQAAVADGLLIEESADVYHFSHDQIWLAAYSLTPPADRNSLHLRIGRQLRKKASSGDAGGDAFLFTVVDQLKRGNEAVQDHAEELEIGKLNLRAGEKALSAFLFQPAATYLLQGCSLLRPEDWDSEYKLCVRLYLAYAEVQLAQGDNDGALLSVAPVLSNARGHANDMLRARETQIRANTAQAKFQEALQNSSTILRELDIDVSEIDPAAIQSELIKTQALLNPGDITGQSVIQSLLSKPTSTDLRQIGRMRILFYSIRAAYAVNPALMLFMILRMSQLVILDDEITAESSYAIANLSLALTGLGMHDASYLASKLALALLDRFDHKYSNMVTFVLNTSILQYRQPMQACLESQRQAYRGFVSVGDRDFARMSINQISQMSIMAPERGKVLDDVEREIRQVLTEFPTQHEGSKSLLIMSVMFLQTLLNLKEESPPAGIDDDPTILTGSVMDQEECLKTCEEKGLRDYFRHFFCCRLYLAYLFRRHSLAEDTVKSCVEMAQLSKLCSSTENIAETFYMGLVAAEAIQRRRGAESSAADIERWQKMANDSLNSLTTWANEGSEWNFLHKVELLRAEIAVANGDYDTAISSYQGAIAGAGKSSYVNEEALSCERAGLFYFAQGEMEEGKLCLSRAVSLYRAWGARRKALDVLQLMGS